MAVNLDLIICDYLKNRVSRMGEASLKELLELFQLIKTGIYLSKFDMINKEGILSEHDELKITSGYVLKFLERKHRVTLFDSGNKVNNDGLKTLYNRIQFYRRTDVNSGFVRVKRLIELLNKNREEILAVIHVSSGLEKMIKEMNLFHRSLQVLWMDLDMCISIWFALNVEINSILQQELMRKRLLFYWEVPE